MSAQAIAILTLSMVAAADLAKFTFVGWDGDTAAAGENSAGAVKCDTAAGDIAPVDTIGTTVVLSGAAIVAGAALEVGADGKAITQNTGVLVARALDAATGAGQPIEVLLIPN